jgi:glycosyltransferase involved in cell wall biosynthesis
VKIVILSGRRPAPGGKGDQLRAYQFATALSARHDVTVACTDAGSATDAGPAGWTELVVSCGRIARVAGALGALLRGQPLQVGWMMPRRAWRRLRREAESADVVLALTVRSLREPLAVALVIDHVDALSRNMRRRRRGPEPLAQRLLFGFDALLLGRWERSVARHAVAQLAISAADAAALPAMPALRVVPNAVDLPRANPQRVRELDVIFTGNMRYPPNLDAANWLRSDIVPCLRRMRPATSVAIVGRDAGALAPWDGVEIRSDVADLFSHIAGARVAVVPLRLGTGAANKVLEAIAAGAVVVGTSEALEPFGLAGDAAIVADDPAAIAAAITALLDDPPRLDAMRAAALAQLGRFDSATLRATLEDVVARAAR